MLKRKHGAYVSHKLRVPLARKIDEALDGKSMSYHDLALKVFPDPSSWRYRAGGGPPGCFMTLSAALRMGGFHISYDGYGPGQRIVHPRNVK